jgi:hypothetical protein
MGGTADVVEAAGPEQRNGGEKRRSLLRRHGKPVGAQQRREGHERRGGIGQNTGGEGPG